MYKPPGLFVIMKKDNNEINHDVSKKLIPRCLVTLFLTMNFIWGFDFGFIKYFDKKTQKRIQFVTFLINVFVMAVLSLPFCYITIEPAYAEWQLLYLLQYVIDCSVLNCTKYKLYDFIVDVSAIGFGKINKPVTLNNYCVFILPIYVFGIHLLKYMLIVYILKFEFAYFTSLLPIPCEIYGIWYFCTDLVPFVLIIIYYYIYLRVKNLSDSVHDITINTNFVLEQYEAIADCYDKIMPLYDKIVSIRYFCNRNVATKSQDARGKCSRLSL